MTDFIVIGGGIAGLSLAAELAPHGAVLLLEAETHPAWHASGRSAALYEPGYGPAPVIALTQSSGPAFAAQGLLTPRQLLLLASAEERAAFAAEADAPGFHEISHADALERLPILNPAAFAFAAEGEGAADIDTDLMIQNCIKTARRAGAEIRCNARIEAIRHSAAGWQVTWAEGTARAPVLVNAAGAWADHIAGLAGVASPGFTPLRRSMARIPAPEGADVSRWPMAFGLGEAWYMKPDAGALIVSPAEEDPVDFPHDVWADDMVLAEGLARYEAFVSQPVTRLLASWAGLRTFSPDRAPVIGFAPGEQGFFWLAGQGGYGFQTAPAASRLAADLILGRANGLTADLPADLIAALAPERFA